jgi:adenylate cyclase
VTGTPERVERRLAAIFAADVAGYSRLMDDDEVETLRALTAHREIMDRLIAQHGGRIANTAGDSVLAEFPSAVDAVQCAADVQRALAHLNEGVASGRALRFRIGIHVGDVMVRGGDLLGDSVNIAARLEGLAPPGGVYISGDAHRQVRKVLSLSFDDCGPQQVKNIEEPVRAYMLLGLRSRKVGPAPTSLALPDKPSIAVLPFTNLSDDPEQEYLAEGIVEDLITALSRIKWFFVIARTSSSIYKGRTVDVRQVGQDLGVRYVLEGSIRRMGQRLRITGQLVEAATGTHLWAERYDGDLSHVFDLQDRVTEQVAASIEPNLYISEAQRAKLRPTNNLDAWGLVARGLGSFWKHTLPDIEEAQRHFLSALDLDPTYARAHALLSYSHARLVPLVPFSRFRQIAQHAKIHAEAALRHGFDEPWAHFAMGAALLREAAPREALSELQRAISINPSFALAHALRGQALIFCERIDEGFAAIDVGARLSPRDPFLEHDLPRIRIPGLLVAGRYEELVTEADRLLAQRPDYAGPRRYRCAALALLGRIGDARADMAYLTQSDPSLCVSIVLNEPFLPLQHRQSFVESLRLAGLRE